MQLSSREAIRLGYVRDNEGKLLNPSDYNKESSVDITIGEILSKNKSGKIVPGVGATIRPQESLVIISSETIHVPTDYVAYVFLKNTLSQKGLLALNTGIIDAGYVGPIATVIINFSNIDAVIPSGKNKDEKEFFRVVFHKIDSITTSSFTPQTQPIKNFTGQNYIDYKANKINALENLPKTFLEPKYLEKKIHDAIYKKISGFSLAKLGSTIALLGLLFTILPMAKDWFFEWKYDVKDSIIAQTENELKIQSLEKDIDQLKEKVNRLQVQPNKRNDGR